jgi:hypothetical protein
MRNLLFLFFVSVTLSSLAQTPATTKLSKQGKEYHVSVDGNDTNDGSKADELQWCCICA